MTLRRIRDDITNLLLSIISAMQFSVIPLRDISGIADDSLFSPCTHLSQSRILLYFNPPALILSQMPVQHIHIVQRHHVNESLDLIDIEKMTAHIKVGTTITECRLIGNSHSRKRRIRSQALAQSLSPVKDARSRTAPDGNTVRADCQLIAFLRKFFVNVNADLLLRNRLDSNGQSLPRFLGNIIRQESGLIEKSRIRQRNQRIVIDKK